MTGSGYAWIVTEQATSFYLILGGFFGFGFERTFSNFHNSFLGRGQVITLVQCWLSGNETIERRLLYLDIPG
jgi:hypothetical protein